MEKKLTELEIELLEQIEDIVRSAGKFLTLENLISFFPFLDRKELIELISESSEIEMSGKEMVKIKNYLPKNNKEELTPKEHLDPIPSNSSLNTKNLSYKEILKIIDDYNENVKKSFSEEKTILAEMIINDYMDEEKLLEILEEENFYLTFKLQSSSKNKIVIVVNELNQYTLDKTLDDPKYHYFDKIYFLYFETEKEIKDYITYNKKPTCIFIEEDYFQPINKNINFVNKEIYFIEDDDNEI